MCWSSKILEKKIATEDIKTFKVGYERVTKLRSYYRWFIYDFNQLYETEIYPEYSEGLYAITQGFHSYNPKKCTYERCFNEVDKNYSKVQSKTIGKLIDKYFGDTSVFECIIPKGSEYYENEDGEIVSNQIIIKKILNHYGTERLHNGRIARRTKA